MGGALGAAKTTGDKKMSKSIATTLDRIQQAKDALMFARDSAERELPKAEARKLSVMIGKIEALQHKLSRHTA